MHLRLAVFFIALLSSCAARAAIVIDQNQPQVNTFAIGLSNPIEIAQSFKPGGTNVAGVGVGMEGCCGDGVTHLTLSLWTNLPSAGGSKLAQGTGSTDNGTWVAHPETRWVDVFWSPVIVTPGATLFLLVQSQDGKFGLSGYIEGLTGGGNAYPDGSVFSGGAASPFVDYRFRTFTENGVSAVPEPGTWVLMLLGFTGLGLFGLRVTRAPRAAV